MPRTRALNRLTDAAIRSLKRGDKVVRLWDGGGLYFEIRPEGPRGRRLWLYKYTFGGKERRMSIGPYPDVSLAEARQRRAEAARQVRDGVDPILARKAAKQAARADTPGATVEAVCREWMDTQTAWTPGYRDDVERAFAQHIFPAMGAMPIATVTPAVLHRLAVAPLVGLGRLETARRLRQKLEHIWDFALITERASSNAAAPLKRMIGSPNVTNFASAKEEEVPRLLVALRAYGNVLVLHAVLLQVLTAVRPGEARGLLWDEVDLDGGLWTIAAARTKRRRDHVVPLSTQALDVLRSLHAITGAGPVGFPSRSRWDVSMSEGAARMAFERVGFGHLTRHGFRTLFSTTCHEHGHESHVIEWCLAHLVGTNVSRVYNKAQYLPQRRELLQWWGSRVEGLCKAYTDAKGLTPIFPLVQPASTPPADTSEP